MKLDSQMEERILVGPKFPQQGTLQCSIIMTLPLDSGITNMGWQCIADTLIQLGCAVGVSFADSPDPNVCEFGAHIDHGKADLILISVPFETELVYVTKFLKGVGLSVNAKDRDTSCPVIIAGGMANLLPIYDFVDAIVYGDGRRVLPHLIQRIVDVKCRGRNIGDYKREIFLDLPSVLGKSNSNQRIYAAEFIGIEEKIVHSLWTSPNAVYDEKNYINIMLATGCLRKCPYCVLGNCYTNGSRSVNLSEMSQRVIDLVVRESQLRKIEWVRLLFASSGNLSKNHLKNILEQLCFMGFKTNVGSLSISTLDDELIELLRRCGQSKLTIAPESNSRLRAMIGKKNYSDELILRWVDKAARLGMTVALYTLVGLPGETNDDLDDLGRLLLSVQQTLMPYGRPLELHINQVFPKPHTPMEWHAPISPDSVLEKINRVKNHLEGKQGTDFYVKTVAGSEVELLQIWLARVGVEESQNLLHYEQMLATGGTYSKEFLVQQASRRYGENFSFNVDLLPWKNIVFADHSKLLERYRRLKPMLVGGM